MTFDDEGLLTVREVARRVGRSEETVRRWIWSGKLPARKLGNQLFVEEGELGRVRPGSRVSETRLRYRAASGRPGGPGRGTLSDAARKRLFRKYDCAPVIEDIREHRGQFLPSREEALRHIEEDEAFQDEVLAKFGRVDVLALLRRVREE